MVQPSSQIVDTRRGRATSTIRHALTTLCDAVLGPPPWRAPADIAAAWTQTQCMWTAPGARPRGDR